MLKDKYHSDICYGRSKRTNQGEKGVGVPLLGVKNTVYLGKMQCSSTKLLSLSMQSSTGAPQHRVTEWKERSEHHTQMSSVARKKWKRTSRGRLWCGPGLEDKHSPCWAE